MNHTHKFFVLYFVSNFWSIYEPCHGDGYYKSAWKHFLRINYLEFLQIVFCPNLCDCPEPQSLPLDKIRWTL